MTMTTLITILLLLSPIFILLVLGYLIDQQYYNLNDKEEEEIIKDINEDNE